MKFHRLCHAALQCLLHGAQEAVTAGLYDALHILAAKDAFWHTNRHLNCTSGIMKIVH